MFGQRAAPYVGERINPYAEGKSSYYRYDESDNNNRLFDSYIRKVMKLTADSPLLTQSGSVIPFTFLHQLTIEEVLSWSKNTDTEKFLVLKSDKSSGVILTNSTLLRQHIVISGLKMTLWEMAEQVAPHIDSLPEIGVPVINVAKIKAILHLPTTKETLMTSAFFPTPFPLSIRSVYRVPCAKKVFSGLR